MKSLLILVCAVVLLSGSIVHPYKDAATVKVNNTNLCMNYGDQAYTYNMTQVASDLKVLSTANIKCIRLAYISWNDTQSEKLAVYAQSQGFRVIIGGWFGDKFTPALESSYTADVMTEAKWAQTNNIPQFSLGNEVEYSLSGLTQQQFYTYLETLGAQVRTVYSGTISYETSGDFTSDWAKEPLGTIDMLGINLYCGYACNANYLKQNIAAHGASHVYVSEADADMSTRAYSKDSVHASEVKGDAMQLLSYGVPVYYFTFSTCNNTNGVPTNWGLYQCNRLEQPLTAATLGI